MKIITVISLIILIKNCESSCDNINRYKVNCNNIEDIKKSGDRPNWSDINLINSGGNPLQEVESRLFIHFQNLIKITFHNSINGIKDNGFQSVPKLRSLKFYKCNLPAIEKHWFTNLPLRELILSESNIMVLKPKCFENMPNLKKVNIEKNMIYRIPADVFSYTNIEVLYLNNNSIQSIENEAFFGMSSLKKLAMDGNHLTSFEAQSYIGYSSPELLMLWLSNNYITVITKEHFKMFPKIRTILLYQNGLHTIEAEAFSGVKYLSYLDLSNNNLDKIPENVFPSKGLEYLDILFLHNNQLSYLSTDIIGKFPILTKMSVGGNPWNCACYLKLSDFLFHHNIKIVCDGEYLNGNRPICIKSDAKSSLCSPESSYNTNGLSQLYSKMLTNYPKLPPLCKIICDVGNEPCYAFDFSHLDYINN